MQHFQNKNHILMWLEKHCSRKAIVRALQEGKIEFMGGFKPIPPTSYPGWIMRVTSTHDKSWYVAVIAYRDRYGIRILNEVPWKNWVGTFPQGTPRDKLYSGDDPDKYRRLRDETIPHNS